MRDLAHALMNPIRVRMLLVCVGTVSSCPQLWAQGPGVISGTITDLDNRPLPGVRVSLESPDAPQRRATVTDGRGRYEVVNLGVGTYTVTAELPAFRSAAKKQRVTGGRREVWLAMEPTEPPETVPAPSRPPVRVVPLAGQR